MRVSNPPLLLSLSLSLSHSLSLSLRVESKSADIPAMAISKHVSLVENICTIDGLAEGIEWSPSVLFVLIDRCFPSYGALPSASSRSSLGARLSSQSSPTHGGSTRVLVDRERPGGSSAFFVPLAVQVHHRGYPTPASSTSRSSAGERGRSQEGKGSRSLFRARLQKGTLLALMGMYFSMTNEYDDVGTPSRGGGRH